MEIGGKTPIKPKSSSNSQNQQIVSKNAHSNTHSNTTLDDVPPGQEPRDRRRQRYGDRNPHRQQRLVAEQGERERAAGRGSKLRRLVLLLAVVTVDRNRFNGISRGVGIRVRVGILFFGNSAHVEFLEDGFDVDVVPYGNVEASDWTRRDAEVNAQCYFPVFSDEFAETTTGHFFFFLWCLVRPGTRKNKLVMLQLCFVMLCCLCFVVCRGSSVLREAGRERAGFCRDEKKGFWFWFLWVTNGAGGGLLTFFVANGAEAQRRKENYRATNRPKKNSVWTKLGRRLLLFYF